METIYDGAAIFEEGQWKNALFKKSINYIEVDSDLLIYIYFV